MNEKIRRFVGDRVERTGVRVPLDFLSGDARGTVVKDTGEDGIALVSWDGAPDEFSRVEMYHNEIKLAKD